MFRLSHDTNMIRPYKFYATIPPTPLTYRRHPGEENDVAGFKMVFYLPASQPDPGSLARVPGFRDIDQ